MELNDQDFYEQGLNFAVKIKTNQGDALQSTDSKTQPRTKNCNTNESNDDLISICSSEQNKNNLNINLISNNKTKTLKFLIQYKNIYVPKIYLIDYNDTSKYPPKDSINNKTLTQNINTFKFPFSFSFFNFQNNNNSNNEYLNYGYNFNQWKEYANQIRNKLDELNDLVLKGKIRLPKPDNELEYLMALPSDFGGLGNVYYENKYENVKFYDPKLPENKDKQFIKQVKFERNMIWFPLKPNPESLTKKNNPFQEYIAFLKQNNNTNKETKDINNNENKIINETKDTMNNENNNINLNDKEDEKKDNKEKSYKEEKNIKDQNNKIKREKVDKSESRERKKYRSRSRDKSRNRKNSNYRDYSKENIKNQKNGDWKKYNNYKYKKSNYYNNGHTNNYNKRFFKHKRYDNYKYY